ncbi:MAG TPA: SurA N-terminal domain-containing protein [Candidatus Saccharimonadales bacterium]|nr:SurA N-terminal domain-containing protein [Candidatus Saccharimonadales bacterium]
MKRLKKPNLKRLKRLKKPALPSNLPAVLQQPKSQEEKIKEALENAPRITDETVSEHREEVLSSARKLIYPLQHSKHRVVRISVALFALVLVVFFVYCGLALYKFQSTSSLIYGVTRIVPFPVAKADGRWISYESYLFELRRNMHYYITQQQAEFTSKDGKKQLDRLRRQALNQVVEDAYVKQLAIKNHVSVSSQDVDNEVALVRSQNRLGNNERVFHEVLSEFWGWSESDFKRELKGQLLQQAVVAKLDTATNHKAQQALLQLRNGADFAAVASAFSDDASTKGNGGQYGAALTPSDANVAPAVTAAAFQLPAGQVSTIINAGYTLEIIKVLSVGTGSVQAAHIQFTLKPITTYVDPVEKVHPPHYYIHLPKEFSPTSAQQLL